MLPLSTSSSAAGWGAALVPGIQCQPGWGGHRQVLVAAYFCIDDWPPALLGEVFPRPLQLLLLLILRHVPEVNISQAFSSWEQRPSSGGWGWGDGYDECGCFNWYLGNKCFCEHFLSLLSISEKNVNASTGLKTSWELPSQWRSKIKLFAEDYGK